MIVFALGGCGPVPIGAQDLVSGLDEAGRPVQLRVDRVEATGDPEVWLYTMTQMPGLVPYCPADAQGRRAAVPVPGSWDARGAYRDDPRVVTFGCTSGAVGKCVLLGYVPSRWPEHHRACVRMIRADVCGDGEAHTVDGAEIDVWDEVGVVPRSPGPVEAFEAAWSPDGAVYVARPRLAGQPLEPLVAACPDRLRGRTSLDETLTSEQVHARYPDALLFDAVR